PKPKNAAVVGRVNSRRARNPVNTHPNEFPQLHAVQATTESYGSQVSESQQSPVMVFYSDNSALRRPMLRRRFGNQTTTPRYMARAVTPVPSIMARNNESSALRRYRDSESQHSTDFRSYYAYSHFQPQRIRTRTVRSVDAVQFDSKQGTLILGARVISGLEVVSTRNN